MPPLALTQRNLLALDRKNSISISKMKVLVAGATSSLATSTLIPALLASPYIAGLVLVSRTPLPRSLPFLSDPAKVTQVVHPGDLSALEPAFFTLMRDTHNVRAVVWCVGGTTARFAKSGGIDAAKEANVALPIRFLELCVEYGLVPTPSGLTPTIAQGFDGSDGASAGDGASPVTPGPRKVVQKTRYEPSSRKQPFRFVYFSTHNAEQEQFRSLWKDASYRKMKGAAEKGLLELAEQKGQGMLEVYCLRLGTVLRGKQNVANVLWESMGGYISEELVASKVVKLCVDGRGKAMYGEKEGSGVLDNKEILGDDWANINNVVPK